MDCRINIRQKNLLHVFWFLRQCKTPGSFGSDFGCLPLHWSTRVAAGREGIRRLIFQIQGHNFRTVRKRLYSHRIHVVRQVTPHVKMGKWLINVLRCELRILVKSFVERVYNCYFHFCPLFRSLPGAIADYWWADSELDRGQSHMAEGFLRGTPYCSGVSAQAKGHSVGTWDHDCKKSQLQINPSVGKYSRWGWQ